MKVLLLGGVGFIGTNIIKYAEKHRNDISFIIFDKLPFHPNGITSKNIEKEYIGDFCDKKMVEELFKNHKIDLIIHSLSSTVPVNSINARYDIETNLIPSIDLLDLMVEYKVKRIVFISSGGAIYGDNKNSFKHTETDDVFPRSSYGVVKLAIEKYLFQYQQLYSIEPLVLRLSNPYGKYHFSTKQGVVNIALRAAINQSIFTVWGNGESKKDYIYIEDFCSILFHLIEKNIYNRVLNVGSGEIYSVNEILSTIQQFYNRFSWEYTNFKQLDVSHVELNTSQMLELLDSVKFTSLYNGLSQIINSTND